MASEGNAFIEVALVSISKVAGSDYEFAGLTETIDIDQADKDIEGIALVSGGRVRKNTPEGDTSVTLEIYPTGVQGVTASPIGVGDIFHGFSGATGSNTRVRDLYRVAILWTNDTAATTGFGATAASTSAYRWALANAICTSYKKSYTDGILKVTATFKATAFNKSGTGNVLEEEADNTALATLESYTTTTSFR